jgi:anti-sigma B factor antagonist
MAADGAHIEVQAERDGARLVVAAAGEVDAATAPVLEDVWADADGVTDVELRLDGVTFIDSSGLRALLHLREEAARRGATVRIGSSSPLVDRLLEVTGLREAFPGD